MDELQTKAFIVLDAKFKRHVHPVAAALETKSGEIITAVGLNHFLNASCAETAALIIAMNQGYTDFVKVVAVTKDTDGNNTIANMCGKCRQIFFDYSPGIIVRTSGGDKSIEELLPEPFNRQHKKIQDAVKGNYESQS
ncbi:MAG: hypothetical protein V4678_00550 [Patescibacteria group bacterium]